MSYSNRVYLHGYYSMCIYYFINFRSHQFFSLLRAQWPQLLIFFSSDAHKHIHTDKPTQKHTHTQTNPHRQTNREIDQCLGSLVRGSADEEVIWVVELGSWIGQWRKYLGRGAWFMDQPVKKGFASSELGSWIGRWRKDLGWSAGEEWIRWRSDLGW